MDLDVKALVEEVLRARDKARPPFIREQSPEAYAFDAGYMVALDVLTSVVAEQIARQWRERA